MSKGKEIVKNVVLSGNSKLFKIAGIKGMVIEMRLKQVTKGLLSL